MKYLKSPSVREIMKFPPAAIVIDLSRMPSHGRYVGAWLRGSKSTRSIPLVFLDGDPKKVAAIKKEIPDAIYTTFSRIGTGLKKAIANPPSNPVIPRQMMTTAQGRTTAQKLGIREGTHVGLIDPPADYEPALGLMPDKVQLKENPTEACSITLWFVHDPGEYEARLPRYRMLAKRRLWILWPKGRRDGLNGAFVRSRALEMGLVDYKVCSLNESWSGMLFAIKKEKNT